LLVLDPGTLINRKVFSSTINQEKSEESLFMLNFEIYENL